MEEKRFAVLIDAENVSPKYIKAILDEMTNHGIVTYKRVYGDWTAQGTIGWKNVVLQNSITPIQQYSYTYGKNASDSAMIIDAMDILYSKNVDGFCLASSDSDFTRLAARLRESGMKVIGMGEKKTPAPFVAACNIFKFLEVISDDEPEIHKESQCKNVPNNKEQEKTGVTKLEIIEQAIHKIINEYGDNNFITVAELGNRLQNRYPDFDVRNYGFTKLSKFVSSINSIEVTQKGNIWYVSEDNSAEDAEKLERTIKYIFDMYGQNGIDLGTLRTKIVERHSDFNTKDYGISKFKTFIGMYPWLKIVDNKVLKCDQNSKNVKEKV